MASPRREIFSIFVLVSVRPSVPPLQAGSMALPADSEAFPAGSEALPTGCKAVSTVSETLSGTTESLPSLKTPPRYRPLSPTGLLPPYCKTE